MVLLSVVGLAGVWHKKWMMEVYVEIVILAGSGIWDCSSSSSSMCSQGNQSAKQQSRPGSMNPTRDTQPDTTTTH